MHSFTKKSHRRSLRGWIKWVPVLTLPFSILFFHAWINIEILRADYVLRELNAEARDLAEKLSHSDIAETIHEDPEVLASRAALLEFVQPDPGQRELIRYEPASLIGHREEHGYEMAALDTAPMPEPALDEARSARGTTAATPIPAAPLQADVPIQPEPVTPFVLEIEPAFESVVVPQATLPAKADTPGTMAPAADPPVKFVRTPVVLDLPDNAFLDAPHTLMDVDMGDLESL